MNETVLSYCFMRFKPDGTRITRITDTEIWRLCKNLKIVILLMNELDSLPAKELLNYAPTVELVCSGVARGGQRVLQHPPLASDSAPQVHFTN